ELDVEPLHEGHEGQLALSSMQGGWQDGNGGCGRRHRLSPPRARLSLPSPGARVLAVAKMPSNESRCRELRWAPDAIRDAEPRQDTTLADEEGRIHPRVARIAGLDARVREEVLIPV